MTTLTTPVREIPFARPWITDDDKRAVADVLDGHILTHGPQGKAFEEEFGRFLGDNPHCLSVSSCMAALHLAYLHFGIGPGDEVIVPAQTHTATVHAVEWVGAKPVFVDCDPHTGNLTAERIEQAVTPRTKAISIVHFVGIPCDMPSIMRVADRIGAKVIEDCAIAIGSRRQGKHVGLFGDAGCFSFYPVKHMTTGEGGMFVTRHAEIAAGVSKLRAFGVDRAHGERTVPGMYDVPTLGLNYRMSEMAAALGRSQLTRVPEMLARRQRNFNTLKTALGAADGIRILESRSADAQNSWYCLSAVLEEDSTPKDDSAKKRDSILLKLKAAGVGTSIYYPQPVPRMTYYRRKYGYDAAAFPQAEAISDRSIALPVGPHLDAGDMNEIAAQFIRVLKEEKHA